MDDPPVSLGHHSTTAERELQTRANPKIFFIIDGMDPRLYNRPAKSGRCMWAVVELLRVSGTQL